MSKRVRNGFGFLLFLLGLAVGGVELGRYWQMDHAIHWVPMVVAAILCFVGGAIIDTAKAMQIGNAVVSGAVTVISALPFGRRQTDKLADAGQTIVIPPTGEHPVAMPKPPVVDEPAEPVAAKPLPGGGES